MNIMPINSIVRWFKKAVPEPTERNFNTQMGCYVEEFVEMLETLEVVEHRADEYNHIISMMNTFANNLKAGKYGIHVVDAVGFLDSVCDQVVTGVGAATMSDMDVESALINVAVSNDSKFDSKGEPIFDENGKIIKGPNYIKPTLDRFVKKVA